MTKQKEILEFKIYLASLAIAQGLARAKLIKWKDLVDAQVIIRGEMREMDVIKK